jgi:ArsR family transcriptional regulator
MMTQICIDARSCCDELEERLDPALFKALADPNRIVLVARLSGLGGAPTVTEAASCCPVDISVVSRHLGILRDAGVVEARKHGREVHYRVEHADLARRLRELADAVEACCDADCCRESETKEESDD